MLLIQKIHLSWNKNERGAKGEVARRRFPLAYPLEEKQFFGDVVVHSLSFFQEGTDFIDLVQETHQSLEKYLPQLGFTQAQIQNEIESRVLWIKRYQYQSYPSVFALNLDNLSVCDKEKGLEVTFFYDGKRSGAPFRRGHNKDFCNQDSPFCGKDMLNETAFVLSQNQYGRIIWNERRIDYDTGEWYYELHVYNLFSLCSETIKPCLVAKQHKRSQKNLSDKAFPVDIFIKNKPDFEYRQFASLY